MSPSSASRRAPALCHPAHLQPQAVPQRFCSRKALSPHGQTLQPLAAWHALSSEPITAFGTAPRSTQNKQQPFLPAAQGGFAGRSRGSGWTVVSGAAVGPQADTARHGPYGSHGLFWGAAAFRNPKGICDSNSARCRFSRCRWRELAHPSLGSQMLRQAAVQVVVKNEGAGGFQGDFG